MSNETYLTNNVKHGNLSRYQVSAYQELSIINTTPRNVVIIDNRNRQTVIPPIDTRGVRDNSVVIYFRKGVCSTLSPDGIPMMLNGISIRIDQFKFRNDPIYVDEIDSLICTEEQVVTARHPYALVDYEESLETMADKLIEIADEAPSIRFLANDPTGQLDKVYTYLAGKVTSVPVTHNKAETATLTQLSIINGKVYTEEKDISDLLTGTKNTITFTNKVIPWVTISEFAANEMAKTFAWITPEAYEETKSKLILEHKKALELANSQNSAKVNALNVEITNLETELNRVKAERDDYKARYTTLKAEQQAAAERYIQQLNMFKARSEYDISQGNMELNSRKLDQARTESDFKMWQLILSAALPVLTVIAMELLKAHLKQK